MSHRRKWDWIDAIWMLAALIFLAIVLFPFLMSFLMQRTGTLSAVTSNYLVVVEQALTGSMLVFAVLWIFFLGGTFASFLNVVAGRLPLGNSILGSSHCPHCNIKLSFRDNIPIVGWIRNRGQCSNCREQVSIRYLLVEIVLGLIFLFIVLLEYVSGGITLPIRPSDSNLDWHRMILEPGNNLIPIVGFHLTMICVLFAFVLVELDSQKIPQSILTAGIGFGCTIAIIWPCSILLQWNYPLVNSIYPSSRTSVIISLALGLSTGLAMGRLISRFGTYCREQSTDGVDEEQPKIKKREISAQSMFGLAIVGLFLGWQSVLVVGCLWWMILTILNRMHQNSSRIVADLPSNGPESKQDNAFNHEADNDTGDQEEQQIISDRLDSDYSTEQAAIESSSDAGWATNHVALPHAWLLAIVLIHLSTWRWMNLLR